jgi:hypothetical protein
VRDERENAKEVAIQDVWMDNEKSKMELVEA